MVNDTCYQIERHNTWLILHWNAAAGNDFTSSGRFCNRIFLTQIISPVSIKWARTKFSWKSANKVSNGSFECSCVSGYIGSCVDVSVGRSNDPVDHTYTHTIRKCRLKWLAYCCVEHDFGPIYFRIDFNADNVTRIEYFVCWHELEKGCLFPEHLERRHRFTGNPTHTNTKSNDDNSINLSCSSSIGKKFTNNQNIIYV